MVHRSPMGEQQAEPADDITAMFEEIHGDASDLETFRDDFEAADHMGGWCAEVRNTDGDGIMARGFASQDDLIAYMAKHQVKIV